MNNKNFIAKAFDDIKESAKKQHEIDKQNFNEIKAISKENFENAKKENPDFKEFKDAKGLKAKVKVVGEHICRDSKKISEENREKYKEMLEKQRNNIKNINK